ncbi:dUTP diphosphatase [Intestinimonas massiliensis (ex Afouda et al. 2020)]|uniref:dUTP diphosphatase n=1 Tax=Intestinimonas massiliensis (ex Afouda et al. 2020) TaxID=1673721 RepID=UPI0010321A62|nr:dUTP diphosphatase [Intestinimonas massiliensis (ex Afouda et al. 2020)]
MRLKIKAVSPKVGTEIPLPSRGTEGSAGLDLRACLDEPVSIAPRQLVRIPTGIAVALPGPEYVALVFARSGLGIKHGISLSNGVGVIDSDYRGEIQVGLTNLSDTLYTVQPGDRIAQLVVTPVVTPELEVVEELEDTGRGAGGFGSTGR